MMRLGKKLRNLRKSKKFTLEQAGAEAGVSPSHISLIENGKVEPSLGALKELGKVYSMSVRRMLIGVEEYDEPLVVSETMMSVLRNSSFWNEVELYLMESLLGEREERENSRDWT